MTFTIGMVAGEESGDILGSALMLSLKKRFPEAEFVGIGGAQMIAAGMHSFYPLERLSVMGFIEPLKRLPEILKMKAKLKNYFMEHPPQVFIGIDAPDFNLRLETALKKKGIKTVHYVSPTVWAWRSGRLKNIKRAVDLMLTLFPFEQKIYQQNHIPACFVGHTLADAIPLHSDKCDARAQLKLKPKTKIIALLPGSRAQELRYLAQDFIDTAKWLQAIDPAMEFISACPNPAIARQFQTMIDANQVNIKIFLQQATLVMAASDAILVTSGTATLQAMLIKRPTVIAYKMKSWVFALAKRLVKVRFIGLPNILAEQCIMPEFIQTQVDPALMGACLLGYLQDNENNEAFISQCTQLHLSLKNNAAQTAAQAVSELIS